MTLLKRESFIWLRFRIASMRGVRRQLEFRRKQPGLSFSSAKPAPCARNILRVCVLLGMKPIFSKTKAMISLLPRDLDCDHLAVKKMSDGLCYHSMQRQLIGQMALTGPLGHLCLPSSCEEHLFGSRQTRCTT